MASSSLFTYDSIAPDRLAPTDNILLDYTTKDIPTNIKELFNLIEYISFNSGQVTSAIKKLTEFPITKPVFQTENRKLKERHEKIGKTVKYKAKSLEVGFDYNMYGNSITSVYLPIIRLIVCPACHDKQKLVNANFRYSPKEDRFTLTRCANPKCDYSGEAQTEDMRDLNEKNVNIIRWDLKQIDVEYNEFTGKNVYYYYLSEQQKKLIKENHIDTLCTYPRSILPLAARDNKYRFRFSDDYVFHMKTPNLSGVSKVWGFPPPTPALKSFFYQFMLRKANEAVAMDYLNHLRVIYPSMSQPENNPLQYINMSLWADEMSATIKKWRQDRNFIKLSPHPLGYQTIGGEGRAFLLTNEMREASYDILLTLGIPRELMEGSSAQNLASPVLLRIVENMMLTYMEQMTDWINWTDTKISNYYQMESVEVQYVPFKFIDDIQRKSLLMQWGQGGEKKVSDSTIADQLDVDLDKEQEKIVEDSIRQYKLQKDIQTRVQEMEESLAEQAAAQAAQAQGRAADYNNQAQTIAQADQIASQLLPLTYEDRKSQLASLQKEDFVMYSIVIQRMEDLKHNLQKSVSQGAKLASLKEDYPPGHFDNLTEIIKDSSKSPSGIEINKLKTGEPTNADS